MILTLIVLLFIFRWHVLRSRAVLVYRSPGQVMGGESILVKYLAIPPHGARHGHICPFYFPIHLLDFAFLEIWIFFIERLGGIFLVLQPAGFPIHRAPLCGGGALS